MRRDGVRHVRGPACARDRTHGAGRSCTRRRRAAVGTRGGRRRRPGHDPSGQRARRLDLARGRPWSPRRRARCDSAGPPRTARAGGASHRAARARGVDVLRRPTRVRARLSGRPCRATTRARGAPRPVPRARPAHAGSTRARNRVRSRTRLPPRRRRPPDQLAGHRAHGPADEQPVPRRAGPRRRSACSIPAAS